MSLMWIVGASFVLGIPSAMSLEILGDQDFVWSVGLIISGVLMAIAAIKYGLSRMISEVTVESEGRLAFPCLVVNPIKFYCAFHRHSSCKLVDD